MKEDKAQYQKGIEDKANHIDDQSSKVTIGMTTDISIDNPHSRSYGVSPDGKSYKKRRNSQDGEEVNYLYGTQAFEALDLLTEKQIKQFLPLTNLRLDDEKDPEWVRDYKLFLNHNNFDIKTHMKPLNWEYDLTEDIKLTKEQKWLKRQKYRLLNELRKHNKDENKIRSKNSISLNTKKMNNSRDPERWKSTLEGPITSLCNPKKHNDKIDAGVGTGPDILSMLVQLQNDKISRRDLKTKTNFSQFNETNCTPNKPGHHSNIKEADDEDTSFYDNKAQKLSTSDISLKNYKSNGR